MKIVVTAGGTSERIDNVRKITNSSSGKLGVITANEILNGYGEELEELYYICSKGSFRPTDKKVKIIEIEDTFDLKKAVELVLTKEPIDYFIHSMAVSDYTLDYVSTASLLAQAIEESENSDLVEAIKKNRNVVGGTKISSYEDNLLIMLKPTPKIISMIKDMSPDTFLVGFKLLDGVSHEELIAIATKLLEKNRCNLVVANDLANIRMGNHKAIILDELANQEIAHGKEDIAKRLCKKMFERNDVYGFKKS